jgi:hypothetical protein
VPLVVKGHVTGGESREFQCTLDYQRPIRMVSLSGTLKKGVSPAPYRDAVGKVNDDKWNDLEKGYWLIGGLRSRTTDGGQTYSIQMQLATRVNDDWSQWFVLRDKNTDQYVHVEDADVKALKQFPYEYGILYPEGNNAKSVMRVGPYEVTGFSSIFGAGYRARPRRRSWGRKF